MSTVIGIDVGAQDKGFHAVLIKDDEVLGCCASNDVSAVARWCAEKNPEAIAIDAPCRWRLPRGPRSAEQELKLRGIGCFSTPLEETANTPRPDKYYDWMLNGESLYRALEQVGYFRTSTEKKSKAPVIETFPHAATCAVYEGIRRADDKLIDRYNVVAGHADPTLLVPKIDYIDAAVCGVVAQFYLEGRYHAVGSLDDGQIILPETSMMWASDHLLRPHKHLRQRSPTLKIDVGSGWSKPVATLLKIFDDQCRLNRDFQVLQIKEKLGILRVYCRPITSEIEAEITKAEEESSSTCEACGAPGKLYRSDGWLRTRCDQHETKRFWS